MHGLFNLLRSFLLVLGLASASTVIPLSAIAEEEAGEGEEGEIIQEEIQYVPLKPAFITNYQASKIRYFKTDVTVKVRGNATAEAISRHLPYIRHNLVMLFSSQSSDALNSMEGKQLLQEQAAEQVMAVLNEESESSDVEGILFTSFIVE